jgi:hypothetical protein
MAYHNFGKLMCNGSRLGGQRLLNRLVNGSQPDASAFAVAAFVLTFSLGAAD